MTFDIVIGVQILLDKVILSFFQQSVLQHSDPVSDFVSGESVIAQGRFAI